MAELAEDTSLQVQETADDAITSKLSAVEQGYLDDPFIKILVPKGKRRSPLINRGYFARVAAVEEVAMRFLSLAAAPGVIPQIVSLGAGLDTTFFKIRTLLPSAPLLYIELDLPRVSKRKVTAISRSDTLKALVSSGGTLDITTTLEPGVAELYSRDYAVVNADLRDLSSVQAKLARAGLDLSRPTLFLSECVFVYVEPEASGAVLAWAASLPRAAVLTYEQVHPHDAFGQVMMKHLEARGCPLRSLLAFPDIPSQIARYKTLGWQHASVVDMNFVYNSFLPRDRVARAEKAELFDEFEEWHLMSSHYTFSLAVNEVEGGSLTALLFTPASPAAPPTPPPIPE